LCVDSAFNSDRVIPPFALDSTDVDWRDWDVVAEARNQGICGSCYAFSTIAAAESAYAIATGSLYEFSEQHIVSCDSRNWGCNGGLQWYASMFLTDGMIYRDDLPYTNANTGSASSCDLSGISMSGHSLTGSTGYETIGKSYDDFRQSLLVEPVNISFAVGNDFSFYSSGIYTGAECAS
jgi:C1A family cysteine protease